ncbi:MAG: ADOP family duplicated permease [Acidobacteriaceae bacterium]
MLSFFQDVRFALRQLRRSPGYAIVAIVTLALGIGANTAIFLLTYSIVLKSLPVPHPGQLIRYTFKKGESDMGLSYPLYKALEQQQSAASGIFAWSDGEGTLRRNGQPSKINLGLATGPMFNVLELRPALGRGLDPHAGEPGAAYQPEAVLTYDYWRNAFHADPNVLGKTLNIENQSVSIVGVLPQGFDGLQPGRSVDVMLPLSFERVEHGKGAMMDMGGAFWLTIMGRLKPGETLHQAQANVAAIRSSVNKAADPSNLFLNGGFFSSYTLGADSGSGGRSWLREKYATPLLALEGLCGLMMLLCGVNVALVVLSRVSGRLHEFAMRNALGASRGRLLAQVLTETLILGAAGLAIGSLVGAQLAKVLIGMITDPGLPAALHLQVGFVVFLFASAISLGAALCAGVWPAWRAASTAPASDLKTTGASRTSARLGRWIIPAQVALGVVLLNAALLLTATLRTYLRENSGFAADSTVLGQLEIDSAGLSKAQIPVAALDMLHQVQAMPGVRSAALMSIAPVSGGFSAGGYYTRDSHGNLRSNQQVWPESTSADYFNVMGTHILEGRSYTTADASGDRVCVVSAGAAAFFFPGQSALGQFLNSGDGTEKTHESCRVIGVAQDARFGSLLDAAPLVVYHPIERQTADQFSYAAVGVRAATPQIGLDAIRRVSARVFPTLPAPRAFLFRDAINYDLSSQRLLSSVSGGFAILALALVAIGLYGILARTVTERRREIGIRMALGARRQQIVSALARTAALRIAIGVVAGAALAAGVGRLLQSLLFGVTPGSPMVALATLVLLLAVLAMAFVFPAGRAASVDPMEAIRDE